MANVKITQLTADTNPASTDVLPFVDISSDQTKKVTIADLLENAGPGTASAAAFAFDGDADTGMYRTGANALGFTTGGTGRVFIDSSGNVGIGGTAGNEQLLVRQSAVTNAPSRSAALYLENNANCEIQFVGNSSNDCQLRFGTSSNSFKGALEYELDNNNLLAYTNGSEKLRLDSSGNVGIGTTNPSGKLDIRVNTSPQKDIIAAYTAGSPMFTYRNGSGAWFHAGKHPTDDGFVVTTGATTTSSEFLRIDSSGNLGIGTTDVLGNKVFIDGGNVRIDGAPSTDAVLQIRGDNSTSSSTDAVLSFVSYLNNASGGSNADIRVTNAGSSYGQMAFATRRGGGANTEAMRIDSSGRVLVGTSSYYSAGDSNSPSNLVYVENAGNNYQSFVGIANRTDIFGSVIVLGKTRGAAVGSNTIVQNNDQLGIIRFVGADGVDRSPVAAAIEGQVDNTPGSNIMPGRLVFSTTANNAASPTERMRIDSSGNVGIGETSPDTRLHVKRNVDNSASLGSNTASTVLVENTNANGIANIKLANALDADGHAIVYGTTTSGSLRIMNQSAERMRIDSSGRLLVGASSSSGVNATLQVIGDTAAQFHRGIDAASGASIAISKSRNTTYGSNTIVQDDDLIGTIAFRADDGTDYHTTAAFIGCHVDGTPGANDMPGRLVFATTADGANSSTERLTILSDGNIVAPQVYASTTASAANVNVNSSGYLIRSISSIKFKKDIETIEDTYSDALLNCRPVWYRSKSEHDNQDWGYWGFIAEEVAEIDPRLVSWKTTETTYDEDGAAVQTACDPEPEGVQYDRFVPHLLNLIKRQQQTIEALEQRLTDAGL